MKIYSVRKGILSAGKKEVPMMTTITGIMEWVLENIAGFAIVIFEFIGVAIIIWSGITGFVAEAPECLPWFPGQVRW